MLCKICDVRDLPTALGCAELGTTHLGLHCIDGIKAERRDRFVEIAREVPRQWPSVGIVMVTKLAALEPIVSMAEVLLPTHIQLHNSDWDGRSITQLRASLAGARLHNVRIVGVATPTQERARYRELSSVTDLVIVDSSFWGEARRGDSYPPSAYLNPVSWVRAAGVPVLIAGGITPTNISEYLSFASPDGVDIQRAVKVPQGSGIDLRLVEEVIGVLKLYDKSGET